MPIRINLLAEAQAAEDLRRRDPVKRGIWIGSFLIFCVVLWIGWLQVDIFQADSALKRHEETWKLKEGKWKEVTENERKRNDLDAKLDSLNRLSTNRFLWGSMLNALQTNVIKDIQITRLKTEQIFVQIDEQKQKTNGSKVIPRMPAAAIEKIGVKLEARDYNSTDRTYDKFKEVLSRSSYFTTHQQRKEGFIFSGTLGQLSSERDEPGRWYVSFGLDALLGEVRRNE